MKEDIKLLRVIQHILKNNNKLSTIFPSGLYSQEFGFEMKTYYVNKLKFYTIHFFNHKINWIDNKSPLFMTIPCNLVLNHRFHELCIFKKSQNFSGYNYICKDNTFDITNLVHCSESFPEDFSVMMCSRDAMTMFDTTNNKQYMSGGMGATREMGTDINLLSAENKKYSCGETRQVIDGLKLFFYKQILN